MVNRNRASNWGLCVWLYQNWHICLFLLSWILHTFLAICNILSCFLVQHCHCHWLMGEAFGHCHSCMNPSFEEQQHSDLWNLIKIVSTVVSLRNSNPACSFASFVILRRSIIANRNKQCGDKTFLETLLPSLLSSCLTFQTLSFVSNVSYWDLNEHKSVGKPPML